MGNLVSISEKQHVIQQQSCFLSDDLIIEEILTRLPVKSILRFKSVSKQWYSTLSSSHFANAHLIKSSIPHPSTPVNTLFIQSRSNCYIFSYNDDQISGNFQDNLVKVDVDFGIENNHYFKHTGSCNGLVCLTPGSGVRILASEPAMLRNERLYWSVFGRFTNIIPSFDLVVERFEVIKLDNMGCLEIMGGCLSKCDFDIEQTGAVSMHIFESPEVILKSIDFPKGLRLGITSQMVEFTKTGKFFVTGAFNDEMRYFGNTVLGVIDTGTKPMQYTRLLSFDKKMFITGYVPSLVSPFPFEKMSSA